MDNYEIEKKSITNKVHFNQNRKASFVMNTMNLPVPWEYIYQNGKILLKVDQFGPVYAQASPPSDIMLFKRDSMQKHSSWLTWIKSPVFSNGPFCNFFRPNFITTDPTTEPKNVNICYSPESAVYSFEHEGLLVETELLCGFDEANIIMKLNIKNNRNEAIPVTLLPCMLPYVNPAVLAPWDRPEWYLKSGYGSEKQFAFWTQLLNMNSEKEKRRMVSFLTDKEGLSSVELSYEHFVGQGTFSNPEALFKKSLSFLPSQGGAFGEYKKENIIYGYPPVYAMQYDYVLEPGETKALTQVLSMIDKGEDYISEDISKVQSSLKYFNINEYEKEKMKICNRFDEFLNIRKVETPDKALNQYVNEWLPLQMYWVAALDRGWPSGMRGSRDSANDFTAMIPLDSNHSREIIEILMSCQRSDGWYPRQYSAQGRKGKHDLRGHVDAGAWVIELLYEYLCYTKDFDLLKKELPWLDKEKENSVFVHAAKTMDFYIKDKNIGEHGLCKIGEGDWLDSVNRAGILGRGESVMMTNQVIIALTYMIDILNGLENEEILLYSIDKIKLSAIYNKKRQEFKKI